MLILSIGTDRRYAGLCAGIVLAAIALTFPIAESGVNDDWSYAKTTLDLAQTGHLVYNGWSAAMLGAQAYWGALFIKLFGFSFLVVRLSVAPLAAGCAALLYVLHRRAALPPGLAIFGTLTIALSPVFIPNAASFMTDIPALFLFLASIYGYVRVADVLDAAEPGVEPPASWRTRLWGWLLFGLAAGLLGGTVRQVGWFVPLVAPGVLLLRCRTFLRLRPARFPLMASTAVALSGALAFSAWFKDQPYAVHEKISTGLMLLFKRDAPALLGTSLAYLLQTLGALILPLLITLPMLYRRWLAGQGNPLLRGCSALTLTFFFLFLAWLSNNQTWVYFGRYNMYFGLGNLFSMYPLLLGTAPIPPDAIPASMPLIVWNALALGVTALTCGTLALWVAANVWPRRTGAEEKPRDRMPAVIGLFAAFSVGYVPLLMLKGLVPDSFGIWDRYLLLVLPLATMGFLSVFRKWTGRERVPLMSWLVLALFGYYGVAQTHDYFTQLRARLAVTQYLESRGIPRARIMGGFEYDSWTQLEKVGYYNDSRIEKPEGVYIPPPESPGFVTIYSLWRYTPVVKPDYVVALWPHPDLLATDVPPTEFRCWLRPHDRRLVVQVSDPALAAVARLSGGPPPTR